MSVFRGFRMADGLRVSLWAEGFFWDFEQQI